jgi:hypothetical protein
MGILLGKDKMTKDEFKERWIENLIESMDAHLDKKKRIEIRESCGRACAQGGVDPNIFGTELDSYLKGTWFIRNRMLHDFYQLNKMELLLWDSWGLMDYSREEPTEVEIKLLDKIASLTQA